MHDLYAEYERRTPRSGDLAVRASEALPGGDSRSVTYHRPYPTFVESASGCTLTTVDGERLLDLLNNYTQAVVGHTHPKVVSAVQERFAMGNGLGAPTEEAVELAERLVGRLPSVERVRFCNSGTEATMNAIRGAMAHTGEERVLKVLGGYHGTHDVAEVAVSGPGRENEGIPRDVEARVETVPFNDGEALKAAFAERGDDLACFVVEPLLGAGGTVPPADGYLETARDLTRDHDVPLVFDEVVTFRLAPGGAQERYGVEPDLTTLGKAIGGGLPVGAFGGREDLMAVYHPEDGAVSHSGTFNANPATMAGGLATLDLLDAAAIEELNDRGARLRTALAERGRAADRPVQVTGDGSLFQVHLTDRDVSQGHLAASGPALAAFFLGLRTRGVFLSKRGTGNLSTPMGEAAVDKFLDAAEGALADAAAVGART